jgi:Protein of unknown function (DUF1592)/Protein of unknown function (DUF1588)/Protein of unknown function (DUF1595)/Protein of unknown function (DUF1585)/Protein of unknown function (DUF1587)
MTAQRPPNRPLSGAHFLASVIAVAGLAAACGPNSEIGGNDSSDAVIMPGTGGGSSSGGGSATGGSTTPGTGGSAQVVEVDGLKLSGNPVYYRVVRLTHTQWENSVRDVLMLPEVTGLSEGFIADAVVKRFTNNETSLEIAGTLEGDYGRVAGEVATTVTGDSAAMARLGHAGDAAGFINALGHSAFRRALTADEVATYTALWDQGATFFGSGDDFKDGARVFIEALLRSPYFLYRVELTEAGQRLAGTELATRLSFLLRNTTPDAELLSAAESGTLDTDEGLAQTVTTMLEEVGTQEALRSFHFQLLGIDRFVNIEKDTTAFPTYKPEMKQMFIDEQGMFFDYIYTEGLGYRDILQSDVVFVNATTAPIYGLQATGNQLQQKTVGPERPGYLTRAGYLALNAGLTSPSPIKRGVDVVNRLLCGDAAPPADLVIPPIPEAKAGQTNRDMYEEFTGTGVCGGCHNTLINPPGYALENFDALGKVRTTDANQPVDTTGNFGALPENPAFTGIVDVVNQLAEHRHAHACYSARLAEFALARDIGETDSDLLASLQSSSLTDKASLRDMLVSLVQSPAFKTARQGAQ